MFPISPNDGDTYVNSAGTKFQYSSSLSPAGVWKIVSAQILGVTGLQGVTGLKGPTGNQGFTGLIGLTGAYGGPPGSTGSQGIQGSTGPSGIQGVTGLAGSGNPIIIKTLDDNTLDLNLGLYSMVMVGYTGNVTVTTSSYPITGAENCVMFFPNNIKSYTIQFDSMFRTQGSVFISTFADTTRRWAFKYIYDGIKICELSRTSGLS